MEETVSGTLHGAYKNNPNFWLLLKRRNGIAAGKRT
jgi:hypothetical protein